MNPYGPPPDVGKKKDVASRRENAAKAGEMIVVVLMFGPIVLTEVSDASPIGATRHREGGV